MQTTTESRMLELSSGSTLLLFEQERLQIQQCILGYSSGGREAEIMASILASWELELGGLKGWMGLTQNRFKMMLNDQFPGYQPKRLPDHEDYYQKNRLEEQQDLIQLLRKHLSRQYLDAGWIVDIVCHGSLASNHLWEDIGLWSRLQLTELMGIYFPTLSLLNTKNMKWKRFLYKQLCIGEGLYVCRSPSCEACDDYANCFA